MEKNKKKKLRDIRNAVVMMCVMVAMMSTASYAWFTMSSSPTVTGMEMTAATSGGGLLVANKNEKDEYAGAIEIEDESEIEILKPVTLVESKDTAMSSLFKGPVYTGEDVSGFVSIGDTDAVEGYVAKYTYYLKETSDGETGTVDVGIICGDSTTKAAFGLTNSNPNLPGSFVRQSYPNETADGSSVNPSYAVRVGFVVKDINDGNKQTLANNKTMVVWEPNNDGTNDGTAVTYADALNSAKVTEECLVLQSKKDGSIDNTTVTGGTGNTSNALFTMNKDSVVMIEMYVWLQGSDEQCVDQIKTGYLEAQVQFTVVGDSAETTP